MMSVVCPQINLGQSCPGKQCADDVNNDVVCMCLETKTDFGVELQLEF